jgi:hypothetical protein
VRATLQHAGADYLADLEQDDLGKMQRRLNLRHVLAAIEEAGVQALAYKGEALSVRLYGDPDIRPSSDLDLLVRKADIATVVRALEPFGYCLYPRQSGIIQEVHLVHRNQLGIDLHWGLADAAKAFPFRFDELWRERQVIDVGTARVPFPSDAWLLVILAFYTLRKLPAAERRYLGDLIQLIRRAPDLDWVRVRAIAGTTRTVRITTLALALATEAEPGLLPSGIAERWPRDGATKRLLAKLRPIFTAEQEPESEPFVSYLRSLPHHARYREAWRDRLRPFAALPLYLIMPDDIDVLRARKTGRSAWVERVRRVHEVVATLQARRRLRKVTAAFHAGMADGTFVPTPTAEVSFHPIGDEALLLDEPRQQLFRFDPASTYLWELLEWGTASASEIADAYAEATGMPRAQAIEHVGGFLVGCWEMQALEGSRAPVRVDPHSVMHEAIDTLSNKGWRHACLDPADTVRRVCDIEGSTIILGFREVAAADEGSALLDCDEGGEDAEVDIAVGRAGEDWTIRDVANGALHWSDKATLGEVLLNAVERVLLRQRAPVLAMRASLLQSADQQALVLGGEPGAVKAMASTGWRVLASRLVLLTGQPLQLDLIAGMAGSIRSSRAASGNPDLYIYQAAQHSGVVGALARFYRLTQTSNAGEVVETILTKFQPEAVELSPALLRRILRWIEGSSCTVIWQRDGCGAL